MVWCFKLLSWMCTCLIVLKLHFVLIFFDTALPPTLSLVRTTRPNYWLSRPTNSCSTEHDSVGVFDLAGFIIQGQDPCWVPGSIGWPGRLLVYIPFRQPGSVTADTSSTILVSNSTDTAGGLSDSRYTFPVHDSADTSPVSVPPNTSSTTQVSGSADISSISGPVKLPEGFPLFRRPPARPSEGFRHRFNLDSISTLPWTR